MRIEDGLYGADAEDLLDRLRTVPVGVECVLVIGHNPALHDLALRLAGDGDDEAMQQLRAKFPTGALATLEFDAGSWAKLGNGRAHLTRFVAPKSLSG